MTNKLVQSIRFTAAQALAVRVINNLVQLSLVFYLTASEFAVLAIVTATINLTSITQQVGIADVLTNRHESFHLWRKYGSSLAIILAGISGLLILAVGLGYATLKELYSAYFPYFAIIAVSEILKALTLIPSVKAKIDLDFKTISQLSIIRSVFYLILLLVFLFIGLRLYSIAIANLVASILFYLLWWKRSKLSVQFGVYFSKLRYVFGRSMLSLVFSVCERLKENGDYMVLAIFFLPEESGVYYIAYLIASQIAYMIVGNTDSLVFPYLTKYRSDKGIRFVHVLELIQLVIFPVLIMQILFLEDLIELTGKVDLYDTIFLVKVISIGMLFRITGALWHIPLKLSEDYAYISKVSLRSLLLFILPLLLISYFQFSIESIAYWVLVYSLIYFPLIQHKTIFRVFQLKYLTPYRIIELLFVMVSISIITVIDNNYHLTLYNKVIILAIWLTIFIYHNATNKTYLLSYLKRIVT